MRVRRISQTILSLGIVFLAACRPGAESDASFYFGVDLSYVNEMDDCGAIYLEGGEPRDAFRLFRNHGANLVRARLWHNPDWTDYSNLGDVERTLRRARDVGMSTLLDFHYSDDWADPHKQWIPGSIFSVTHINIHLSKGSPSNKS